MKGSLTQECGRQSDERLNLLAKNSGLKREVFLLDDGFTNTRMATADWINQCLNCEGMSGFMHIRNRKVYQS